MLSGVLKSVYVVRCGDRLAHHRHLPEHLLHRSAGLGPLLPVQFLPEPAALVHVRQRVEHR